jgi:hypothetical protein
LQDCRGNAGRFAGSWRGFEDGAPVDGEGVDELGEDEIDGEGRGHLGWGGMLVVSGDEPQRTQRATEW